MPPPLPPPAHAPPPDMVGKGNFKGGHKGKGKFPPWAAGKGGKGGLGGSLTDAWGGRYVDGGYIDWVGTFWECAHCVVLSTHAV